MCGLGSPLRDTIFLVSEPPAWHYGHMKPTVRVQAVSEQDRHRRVETAKMTPSERMTALLRFRDEALPAAPMKRQARIRRVSV